MTTVTPIEGPASRADAAGRGARIVTVQVLAATPAARDAVTFALSLPGTRRAPCAYTPGQFITLAFPTAPDVSAPVLYRSYSLCGDGRADLPWEITVKRTPEGVISNFLLDHIRPGMLLRASLPQGTFTLPADLNRETPIVLVAGGSGITPMYGMLRGLARLDASRRPPVWLHYAYHSPADAIYGRELAALDREGRWLAQRRYVATAGHRLQPEQVIAALGDEAVAAEWYVCGPTGLKRDMEAEVVRRGVPARRLHAEVFASPVSRDARLRSGSVMEGARQAKPAHLRLADSGAVLDTEPGETLLETLERHGYRPDFSCRAGACGTCRLRLLAGNVQGGAGECDVLTEAERAQGYILSCVAEPRGAVTLATAGAPVAAPPRSESTMRAGAAPLIRRQTADWRRNQPATRKKLRVSLAAAALGLFVSVWGFTGHTPATPSGTATSSTSSSGSSSSSSSASSSNGSSASSSNNSNGSSSITTQPSSSSTNSSSGVS